MSISGSVMVGRVETVAYPGGSSMRTIVVGPGITGFVEDGSTVTIGPNSSGETCIYGSAEVLDGIMPGEMLMFGIAPPPPLQFACSIAPEVVAKAGDPVTVTGTATNLLPCATPEYTFNTTGGKIVGTGNVINVDTTGLADGWYTVKGHVSDGTLPSRMADCEVQFCVGNDVG